MTCVGKCGAYGARPKVCQDYPTISDFIPPGCTFYFHNGERRGSCDPTSCGENNCCSYPRKNGNPEGKHLDHIDGGLPCKHLKWEEEDAMEKDATGDGIVPFEAKVNALIAGVLHDVR